MKMPCVYIYINFIFKTKIGSYNKSITIILHNTHVCLCNFKNATRTKYNGKTHIFYDKLYQSTKYD